MALYTFDASAFVNTANQQPLISRDTPILFETQWQISTDPAFGAAGEVLDTWFSTSNLLSLSYDLDLTVQAVYYVRVRFRDTYGAISPWADAVTVQVEPAPRPEQAPSYSRRFMFFGRRLDNAIMLADTGLQDQGQDYALLLRTSVVSPAGLGGECLFLSIFLKTMHLDGQEFLVTPIIDGQRLPATTITLATSNQAESTVTEIGIYRSGSPRKGQRGASIQVEVASSGPLTDLWWELHGCEVEYVPVREAYPMITPTAVLAQPTEVTNRRVLYTGTRGSNQLARFAQGRDDLGQAVVARVETNEVAPAGQSGECIFTYAYLVLTRANTSTLTLLFTPIVDNVEYATQTLTFAGVTDLVTSVEEIRLHYVPDTTTARVALRGQWIRCRVETEGNLPEGDVWLEGVEVEYERVTESRPQHIGV